MCEYSLLGLSPFVGSGIEKNILGIDRTVAMKNKNSITTTYVQCWFEITLSMT